MNEPVPVTTRVGGGLSPLAAAAAIAVTLAVIVGAAFVNRPPAPPPAARVVLEPTALPGASSRTDTTASSNEAVPAPRNQPGLGDDAFAAIGLIGGRQYPIILADAGDGTLGGSMRLPFPRPDMHGTLELAQLWNRAPSLNFQSIGRWSLPLDLLMPELRGSGTVLTISELARPLSGDNRLVRNGFHMEIRLESGTNFGMIFVTLTTPLCGDAAANVCTAPPTHQPPRYVVHYRAGAQKGVMGK